MAFIDNYTHLYEIVRHQLSYMQLYNTEHAYNLLQTLDTIIRVRFNVSMFLNGDVSLGRLLEESIILVSYAIMKLKVLFYYTVGIWIPDYTRIWIPTIWIPNILKFWFPMVGVCAMFYVLDQPFKYQTST